MWHPASFELRIMTEFAQWDALRTAIEHAITVTVLRINRDQAEVFRYAVISLS